jgi:hypothetical protein
MQRTFGQIVVFATLHRGAGLMRAFFAVVGTTLVLLAGTGPGFSADDQGKNTLKATAPGPEGAQHATPDLKLADADKDAVKKSILGANTHQPTPDKFEPTVGGEVPKTVYVHGLPQDVIQDRPALKQFMYAHLDRSIILIDAVEKKVAAVIPLNEKEATVAPAADAKKADVTAVGGLPQLDDAKKQAIYRLITDQNAQAVPGGEAMRAGVDVPDSVQLAPLPQEVAAQVPELAGKQYARLQDGRLLIVDAGNRKVAGIITKDEGTQTAQGGASEPRDGIRAHEDKGGPTAYTSPGNMGQTNTPTGQGTNTGAQNK